MSQLISLAERVERATASQAHLFLSALELMHPKPESHYQPKGDPEFAPEFVAWAKLDAKVRNFVQFGAFLDAAAMLVPAGYGWTAGWGQISPDEPMGGARISRNARFVGHEANYDAVADAEAATPALALLSACLRSLADILSKAAA